MRTPFLLAVAFVCIAWRAHAVETVLVMRHCVRSTTNHMEGGAPGFNSYDNYTAQPWPPWPHNLAPYLCLPNGLSIVQGTGKWLAAHGGLAHPIAVTSDNVARDIETSHALASGLAFPAFGIVVNHAPFGNACPGLNSSYRDAAIEANLRRNPLTERYYTALAALQQVTGKGAAPLLRDIPNVVAGGFLDGGIEAGGSLAERLLMELGGDMTVGWGRVADPMDVYNIVNVHSIDRFVGVVVPEIQSQEGASITEHVVNALADGQPGTQIFVGHDDQMWSLAATLDLFWEAKGLPYLPTLPGSMLRFDLDATTKTVTVSYMYTLFTNFTGDLSTTPVTIGAVNSNVVSLDKLRSLALDAIDRECVVRDA